MPGKLELTWFGKENRINVEPRILIERKEFSNIAKYSPINSKKTLSRSHDLILVYAKNKTPDFELNKLPRTAEANKRYKNPDNDPRVIWKSGDLSVGPRVEANVAE